MQRKKIFIIMQKEIVDTIGGTISVFTNLCNLLIENNFNVYGLFFANSSLKPKNLNEKVNFINLKTNFESFSKGINSAIEKEKPNLIIFFSPSLYVNSKLDIKFENIPRILMFHGRPDYYFAKEKGLLNKLKKQYTNTITQILIPSYANLLPKYIDKKNIYYIPNSTTIDKIANLNNTKKKMVYLSRVAPCKGIDFLIKSTKIVFKRYPDWKLDIYGQAQPEEYKNDLNKLIKKHRLEKNIFLKGITNNPQKTLLNYDFCLFPSYIEGFPLGLIEAQSIGLPTIGLYGCSGVNELIINEYNGYLSNKNKNEYAFKITNLIESKETRLKMQKNTLQEIKKYQKKEIDSIWLNFVNDVLNNNFKSNIKDYSKSKYKLFPIKKVIRWAKYDDTLAFNPIKRFALNFFSIRLTESNKFILFSFLGKKLKRKIK